MVARLRGSRWRNEVAALLLLALVIPALPGSIPLGIGGVGVVNGSLLALQGIALVLVYRSSRVINFAQASLGVAAAMLFGALVEYRSLLRLIQPLCTGDCVNNHTAVVISYVVSLMLVLAVVVGIGWAMYALVIRRFAAAPRLLLTVATIFIGFTILGLTSDVTRRLVPPELAENGAPPGTKPATLPFDLPTRLSGVTFHAIDYLTVIVAVLAVLSLSVYLQRSASGNAIRASAENPERAAMLGINVNGTTGRVWVIASALAGVAGVLGGMAQGASGVAAGSGAEVRILAVAVLARFVSLPLVTVAALVLGVLDQALQWSLDTTVLLDGGLFVLLGALLLLQSARTSRAEQVLMGEWRGAQEVRPIPAQLRQVPAVRNAVRTATWVGALLLLGLPWVLSPARTDLAAAILIYAIIGMSLLVLTGWAGQISLGQVAFAAVGAYVTALLGLPLPLSLLAGAVAGGLAALVVGLPALRLRGLELAVLTLAFHTAVVAVGLNPDYLGHYLPAQLARPAVFGMDLDDQRTFFYVVLLVTVLVVLSVVGMRRSRTARALIAARDNDQLAQSFGIALTRARVGAFVVSGAICGIAGSLLAYQQHGVPAAAFGVPLSRTIFLYSVIGGLGAVAGPLIGFVWYGLPQLLTLPGIIALLFAGPGGLLILLLAPGGLGQIVFGARDDWLRKVARRNRIVVPSLLADTAAAAEDEPAPLAPKARAGGGTAYTPVRYHLPSQWAIDGVGIRSREPQS